MLKGKNKLIEIDKNRLLSARNATSFSRQEAEQVPLYMRQKKLLSTRVETSCPLQKHYKVLSKRESQAAMQSTREQGQLLTTSDNSTLTELFFEKKY